ncbi:hypothetical protein AB836_01290 [Rickettsiales bacterium (ex Bugula neritina AB1)]|nr:hypothetical protein AB836_01290 [Rickettsiales bacterium (ex Bugula neritina AB1)]
MGIFNHKNKIVFPFVDTEEEIKYKFFFFGEFYNIVEITNFTKDICNKTYYFNLKVKDPKISISCKCSDYNCVLEFNDNHSLITCIYTKQDNIMILKSYMNFQPKTCLSCLKSCFDRLFNTHTKNNVIDIFTEFNLPPAANIYDIQKFNNNYNNNNNIYTIKYYIENKYCNFSKINNEEKLEESCNTKKTLLQIN